MSNLKNKTEEVIRKYSKGKDINVVKNVCYEILKSDNSSGVIRGELCECLLVLLLENYIKKNNLKDWVIAKGLILKDLDNTGSNFLTELDVTLFTPKMIYLFECKSYKGEKKLTKECTLYSKNNKSWVKRVDVFDQHKRHFICLYKYVKKFRVNKDPKAKCFKIIMFDFSIGGIKDLREDKFKSLMPLLNENNLYSLFDNYEELEDNWDMKYIAKVIESLEKASSKRVDTHLEYVKSLHHDKENK